MGRLSSLLKPNYRTVQDAEQAAFRSFYVGFIAIGGGLLLGLLMSSTPLGASIMSAGGLVVMGSIIWFILISRNTETRPCPRCGTANSVFGGETHFKCVLCGYVVLLREL